MSSQTSTSRFSTVADFELLTNDRSYPVVQVAPKFLILETPGDIPAGEATLIIRVHGEIIRRSINLPDGASANSPRVRIIRR